MSVLHDIIKADSNLERFHEALRDGADPNFQNEKGYTPVHAAVKVCTSSEKTDKMVLFVQELKRFGAQVNLGSKEKFTPLHLAVKSRNYKMIATLLAAGADINSLDIYKYTALHYACTKCSMKVAGVMTSYKPDLRVVKLLLRKKPLDDIEKKACETPLMLAVKNNNYGIVHVLLKHGASVKKSDRDRNTAMHHAIDFRVDPIIIEELVKYGGSFNAINKKNKSPRVIYFEALRSNLTHAAVEYAKRVIKLILLRHYELGDFENARVIEIHKANKGCDLIGFLDSCHNEVRQMFTDKLSSTFTVYQVIFRFQHIKENEKKYHVPNQTYDKLIKNIFKYKYPAYTDVIVTSICRQYMKHRFCQMSCRLEDYFPILDFECLSSISEYLTNKEMLLFMLAYYEEKPHTNWFRSKFKYLKNLFF